MTGCVAQLLRNLEPRSSGSVFQVGFLRDIIKANKMSAHTSCKFKQKEEKLRRNERS